jgi:hypothetical protein
LMKKCPSKYVFICLNLIANLKKWELNSFGALMQ